LQVVLVWLAHENNIVPAGEREPGGKVQILPRKILVNEQEIHRGFLLERSEPKKAGRKLRKVRKIDPTPRYMAECGTMI
jgi:hypothetical protein